MATCRLTKPTNKQVAHHAMTNKFMGIYAFRVSSRVIMVFNHVQLVCNVHGGGGGNGGGGGGDGCACIHHFGNLLTIFVQL